MAELDLELVGLTLDELAHSATVVTSPLHPVAENLAQARKELQDRGGEAKQSILAVLPHIADSRPVEALARRLGAIGRDEQLNDLTNWAHPNRHHKLALLPTAIPGVRLRILDVRHSGRPPTISASLDFSPVRKPVMVD